MPRSLPLLPIACGLLTLATVVRTQTSPQVPAQAPAQPDAPAATDQLFAKIYPVFKHERCANCHGVVEHYPGFTRSVTPGTHPGGPAGAGLPDPVVDCTQCHSDDAVEDKWKFTAPPNMEWAGLDEGPVCVMEAAEVRLKNAEAGGEAAGLRGSYLNHVITDPLIAQAWEGYAGGARPRVVDGKPNPHLPVPPLTYSEFKAAVTEWVNAGAPCRATGQVTELEKQKTAYTIHQFPGQTVLFEQSAERAVSVLRYRDGSATATVTASGWDQAVTTLHSSGCEIVTTLRNEWSRIGPSPVEAKLEFTVKPDEYTFHFVLPAETTHTRTTVVQTNTCGAASPAIPESGSNVEWNPWSLTLRCPTEFPNNDGTMGCLPTEPHDKGAADGALHRTVKDASDTSQPRSSLYRSPMATARIDTGEGLPVHVKVIWSLRLDQK